MAADPSAALGTKLRGRSGHECWSGASRGSSMMDVVVSVEVVHRDLVNSPPE
jgi:hypothetical protein